MTTMTSKTAVSLKNWTQVPRPYQEAAIARALATPAGGTTLLSSPTGTGKGTMQLGLLKLLLKAGTDTWVVTPSIEVLRGYLERCGATPKELAGSTSRLAKLGRRIHVTTPVRLRNRLKAGLQGPPEVLLLDEAHHATAENVHGGGLRALCPEATFVGFTATPFRATPDETAQLHETWGAPHVVLTIPEAIQCGAWALPTWRVEPLVDDDNLGIVAGDIDADEATVTAAAPLAKLVASLDLNKPTCVTVPSVRAAKALAEELGKLGRQTRTVLGTTPTEERAEAYATCSEGGTVLVSVRVLGEGVDLPWLRRWVDASPTLSPVAFLQKLGRITRPHASGQPEYVGTNRNLERHGYLLQGLVPRAEIKIAQLGFGGGSKRGARAGMLKGVGKLKPIELPLAGGVMGTMWALWTPQVMGGSGMERCVLLDPTSERAISAVRVIDNSKKSWAEKFGPWVLEDKVPAKLEGFKASRLTNAPCTPKQLAVWRKHAENRGLDGTADPTKAQFWALPVLRETKTAITPDGKPLTPDVGTEPKATPDAQPKAPSAPQAPAVADGYYTVVEGEAHRTYRLRTQPHTSQFAPGKQVMARLHGPDNGADYRGVAFTTASNGATELRVWAKAKQHETQLRADWAALTGDAMGAGKRFAMVSGRCWRCRRLLTTPESLVAGIGPECAGKVGADWGARPEAPETTQVPEALVGFTGNAAAIEEVLGNLFGA